MILAMIGRIIKQNLRISYIPAMTWITFLSNFGGFISMWFGLCVVDLSNLLFKMIGPFLHKIKIELEQFCLRQFTMCIYLKYLFNVMWFSLMILQLIDLDQIFYLSQ